MKSPIEKVRTAVWTDSYNDYGQNGHGGLDGHSGLDGHNGLDGLDS